MAFSKLEFQERTVHKPSFHLWSDTDPGEGKPHNLNVHRIGLSDGEDVFERNLYILLKMPEYWPFIYNLSLENSPTMQRLIPSIRRTMMAIEASLGSFQDFFLGQETTFQNLPDILRLPDLSDLTTTNQAAILLSAGPSLNTLWPAIREASFSRKFLIVAVDAVYQKCLQEDIQPDIVVTSERTAGTKPFLDTTGVSRAVLVSPSVAAPQTLAAWRGHRAFSIRNGVLESWFPWKDRSRIDGQASVAPTALNIIGALQIKRAILLGQDLSFASDGRSHTDLGPVPELMQKSMQKSSSNIGELNPQVVETNAGGLAKTTRYWLSFRQDLSIAATAWGMRVNTAAWHGAKIHGIPYQSFSDFLDESHSLPRGELQFPDKNMNENHEKRVIRSKIEVAKNSLDELFPRIRELSPEHIMSEPHFYGLCSPALKRSFIKYLSDSFVESDLKESKSQFYDEAKEAIVKTMKNFELWS